MPDSRAIGLVPTGGGAAMTVQQVRAAVARAIGEAFRQGQRQVRDRSSEAQSLAAALQYAEQLVIPVVELAMDEAVEGAETARLALLLDPEPTDAPG